MESPWNSRKTFFISNFPFREDCVKFLDPVCKTVVSFSKYLPLSGRNAAMPGNGFPPTPTVRPERGGAKESRGRAGDLSPWIASFLLSCS